MHVVCIEQVPLHQEHSSRVSQQAVQYSRSSTINTQNIMDSITAAAVRVATAPLVNNLKGVHPPGVNIK